MLAVLHVTQPTEAGVAAYVAALCSDQQVRGWDVTVACPPAGRLADDLASHGVRRISWQATRSLGASTAVEALRLRRSVDDVRPDVVHLHSSKAGLAGRLAVRGQLPTVFQPHAWSWLAASTRMAPAALAWERIAARWTSVFVCVGEGEAAVGRVHDVRGRLCVVPNGVDLTRYRPALDGDQLRARNALDVPLDGPLAVCVGRVTRQKGQDLLLTAWEAVRANCPAARLALVGTGDLLETLCLQAPSGVIFVGAVDDAYLWVGAKYAAAEADVQRTFDAIAQITVRLADSRP